MDDRTPLQRLEHALRIRFGIAPYTHINDVQMGIVVDAMERIRKVRKITDDDWRDVARRFLPDTGKYVYAGEDMTDLNMLLMQIANPRPPGGTQGQSW